MKRNSSMDSVTASTFVLHPSAFILHPCLFRSGCARWSRRLLHILLVPRQVSFHSIALVAGSLNAVKLIRVNNQLRIDSQASQCLIHLLTSLHRHVEVSFTTEEQRRCLNSIRMQERIREFHICIPGLWIPRWSNLVIILDDVLVGSIERDSEGSTSPARRAFESIVAGDQVISQYPTIAPTA